MARQAASPGIRAIHAPTARLDPWPIPPGLVLSGSPEAAGRFLWQSEDKRLGAGVWTCTPGSFTWDYTWDETICLLEGEVAITDQNGRVTRLKAGDVIFVTKGHRPTWKVSRTARNAFHLRSDSPVEL